MKRRALTSEARAPLCHAPRNGRAADQRECERERGVDNFRSRGGSKRRGSEFEAVALDYLRRRRLELVARNVACRGGEIDLVMREVDGVLVFVEVRARAGNRYGGAAASVGREKQRRLVLAAESFLMARNDSTSACRFDVVAFDGKRVLWLRDAFRADGV
ncbi:YraN family protein [Trinickia sp. LjRoot230]